MVEYARLWRMGSFVAVKAATRVLFKKVYHTSCSKFDLFLALNRLFMRNWSWSLPFTTLCQRWNLSKWAGQLRMYLRAWIFRRSLRSKVNIWSNLPTDWNIEFHFSLIAMNACLKILVRMAVNVSMRPAVISAFVWKASKVFALNFGDQSNYILVNAKFSVNLQRSIAILK